MECFLETIPSTAPDLDLLYFFVSPTLQLCLFLVKRVNHKVFHNWLLEVQLISFPFCVGINTRVLDFDFFS